MEPWSHDGEEREGGKRKGNIGSHQCAVFIIGNFPLVQCHIIQLYIFFHRHDRQEKEKQTKPGVVLLYEVLTTFSTGFDLCHTVLVVNL